MTLQLAITQHRTSLGSSGNTRDIPSELVSHLEHNVRHLVIVRVQVLLHSLHVLSEDLPVLGHVKPGHGRLLQLTDSQDVSNRNIVTSNVALLSPNSLHVLSEDLPVLGHVIP